MIQNERGQDCEVNLYPQRQTKLLGRWDISDCILYFVAFLPITLIIGLTAGISVGGGIAVAVVAVVWAVFCFANSKTSGKLRTRLWRWISWGFKNKQWGAERIKALYRVKEIKGNQIKYRNDEKEGYISIYRIGGYDLSLSEPEQIRDIIDEQAKWWGNRHDWNVIATGILYQIPKKHYNLQATTPSLEWLKKAYDTKMDAMNHDYKNKQQAYFLIIDGDTVEKNKAKFEVLERLGRDAKLLLTEANDVEMEQVLNTIWPELSVDLKNPNKVEVKRITAKHDMLKMVLADGSFEWMAFRGFSRLPNLGEQEYLRNILNNPEYTVIMNNRYMSVEEARIVVQRAEDSVSSIIGSKWFANKAGDAKRREIQQIEAEIKLVASQLARNSRIYEMREVIFYVLFKAPTKEELNRKIGLFESNILNYEKGFVIEDMKYLQMEALINTRLYKLPQLQFRKDYIQAIKNALNPKRNKTKSTQTLPMTVVRDASHNILNTSLAIGYPFVANISVGDKNTWYKGDMIDDQGISVVQKPVFENYFKINKFYNSFNRFYLAKIGAGKTTAAKRDIIQDRFDDRYIIIIDLKPDYGKLVTALGGYNIVIGKKNATNKEDKFINLWDVLVTPNELDSEGQEVMVSPLQKTYIKNDAVITALLNLDDQERKDYIISAWDKIQKHIYESKGGLCKFNEQMDFTTIDKQRMPRTQDFYNEAVKRAKDPSERNRDAFNDLAILLEKYCEDGVYGYLMNHYSNIDWTKNRLFNLDFSNIARTSSNILAAFVISALRVSTETMIANKNSGSGFVQYIDELHSIRRIPGVLAELNRFARIDRSHNGALCLIDQGLGVVKSGELTDMYNEIFEQTQYSLFFWSSENDVTKIAEMLAYSGRQLSYVERKFITSATPGRCLNVMTAYDRFRSFNNIEHWKQFLDQVDSKGRAAA